MTVILAILLAVIILILFAPLRLILSFENSAFRVSVNGEGEYYTCSKKDDFLNKLLELQGR